MRIFTIIFLLLVLPINGHTLAIDSGCGTVVWDEEEVDLLELTDALGMRGNVNISLNDVLGKLCSKSKLVAEEMDFEMVDFKLVLYTDYFKLRSRLNLSNRRIEKERIQAFYARGKNEIHFVLYESNPMILLHELAHHYYEQIAPGTDNLMHEAVARYIQETLFVKFLNSHS
tara:strand:- start:6060 stop:6575 length:516 start_codon:yes stop_codon:yes gene_type:complete